MPYVSGAVEGPADEAAFRRIVASRGVDVARVQVQGGKPGLRRALPGYHAAARWAPWPVLVDLDQDFVCAPALVRDWLPAPNPHMYFRVVVRQIESWLLADGERFSTFFSVPRALLPHDPDAAADAKAALLALIRRSRRKAIREDMLPRPGSGRRVGPAYTSRLIEYATDRDRGWRPDAGAARSASLAKCLARIEAMR